MRPRHPTGSPAPAAPRPHTRPPRPAATPAQVLLMLPAGTDVEGVRASLREAGFPLVAAVELASGEEPGELLVFATGLGKSLEGFKETLWAVDEFAGVRVRDPHPGPLRRELLAELGRVGPATVTDLRTFALTETVYRAADATRVLQTLLNSGLAAREPELGRLGGDVTISPL